MGRALAAAIVGTLLAVSGAGGSNAQTPKRGGTVVFGPIGPELRCLNPLTVIRCGDGVAPYFWILEKVLTPAFAVAPDFDFKPSLVSGATYSKEPTFIITYRIRPEAQWSDGIPVTSRDFIFTHRARLRLTPEEPIHRQVRSIRAVDQKTVKVVLRSRDAGWRALFSTVLPRHALAGEDLERIWSDDIDNPKTGRPIGSGPFLVQSWERGTQLVLVRNPRYWGPHPARLDRLVVRFVQSGVSAETQILDGLRRGEVDFAASRVTDIVPDLRRIPGIRVFRTTTNGWEHIDIRVRPDGHAALRDPRVRRALAYGIDRVAIARALFGELDPRYPPSDSAVLLTASRYYRSNWSAYRHRPAEARRLLEQAGCRPGADGIHVCGGRRLELRLFTTAGAPLRERTAELVQAQLRRAGVDVRPLYAPGRVLFGQILPSGDFDLASFAWFVSVDASGKKDVFGCGGPQNFSGYCQRLLTEALDQADRILDGNQRGIVLNRVDRQLAREVPAIPLYEIPLVLVLRQSLRNVVVSPNNPFWNAEDWWLDD